MSWLTENTTSPSLNLGGILNTIVQDNYNIEEEGEKKSRSVCPKAEMRERKHWIK